MKTKRNKILVSLAVFFTALMSRAPISSIGQLVPFIQKDLALSAAAAGSVTTIISIMYALMSPVGGFLTARVNAKKLIYSCLLLSFAGTMARTFLGSFGLFTGTILAGLALGILNVQLPIFIRNQFPGRIGFYMGTYTATKTLTNSIAFATVITLMDLSG